MAATLWLDVRRRFLVVERVDSCGADGVRRASFKLATSDIRDVEIPEFQPIVKDDPVSQMMAALGLPSEGGGFESLPWDGGATLPSCCEEPPIEITDVEPGGYASDLLLYLFDDAESAAILVVMNAVTGLWEYLADPPSSSLVAPAGQLMRLSATDVWIRDNVEAPGTEDYTEAEFRGSAYASDDGGETWSSVTGPGVVGSQNFEIFHWVARGADGEDYVAWSSDRISGVDGVTPGDAWRIYTAAGTLIRTTGLDAVPETIDLDGSTPPNHLLAQHGGSAFGTSGGDQGDISKAVPAPFEVAESDPGSFDLYATTLFQLTRKEDYAVIGKWGDDERIVFAVHEAVSATEPAIDSLASSIVSFDRGVGYNWDANPQQSYGDGTDRGRAIGLIHAGAGILFCGWEDGTILRSDDNGDTWDELDQAAEAFASAACMAYDPGNDTLWVVGKDGSDAAYCQVWKPATTTTGPAINATRNLNSVGSLATPRTAGHLGMVVREYAS